MISLDLKTVQSDSISCASYALDLACHCVTMQLIEHVRVFSKEGRKGLPGSSWRTPNVFSPSRFLQLKKDLFLPEVPNFVRSLQNVGCFLRHLELILELVADSAFRQLHCCRSH